MRPTANRSGRSTTRRGRLPPATMPRSTNTTRAAPTGRSTPPWSRKSSRPWRARRYNDRLSVDRFRIESLGPDSRLGDNRPLAGPPGAKEAAPPAGMAGDPLLLDQQQNGVAVAIQAELTQDLRLS